ncbi:MAG: protein phosphatase CheZ [Calditerrivibrio sp.]|nr:protein phosphatase CheZ [Calditerrivibrio sp.]MCA1932499.1 protein phosphatase CheZ [Calditerrivibrio sp.]
MYEVKDLSELIEIAKKINSGEYDVASISVAPEHELFDIVQFFNDAIKKLSTVKDAVEDSYEDLPSFEKVLRDVVKDSKSASEKLLNLTDNVNFNINEIKENIESLRKSILDGNFQKSLGFIDRLLDKAIEGQDISFDMIATLEFQDINKQRIDKLIKIVRDLEKRLSDLILKFGLRHNKIDVDTLNRMGNTDSILENQDLVNQLLKEFGV